MTRSLLTRRSLLCWPALAAHAATRGQNFAAERRRYLDPTTENEVLRMTDPQHGSWLPSRSGRCVSSRGNYLVYASDQSGTMQAHRMDLKSGESKLLSEAEKLDTASIVMSPDERFLYYVDGDKIRQGTTGGTRERDVYQSTEGFTPGFGLMTEDGLYGYTVENGGRKVVQILLASANGKSGGRLVLAESPEAVTRVLPRPRRASVAYYRTGEGWFLVTLDRRDNRKMRLAEGATGAGQWSPDGKLFLYLTRPVNGEGGYHLREFDTDANTDKLVGRTSHFVEFARNGDASVFAGSSGSKGSPLLLLLLRVGRREFPLCEHRAADPARTPPIFSPNSQRLFFQSDVAFRTDGESAKPTIAMMVVDKLVEKTESEITG